MSNPIPRPEISLTLAAVEKSGSKIQLTISSGLKSLIDLAGGQIVTPNAFPTAPAATNKGAPSKYK